MKSILLGTNKTNRVTDYIYAQWSPCHFLCIFRDLARLVQEKTAAPSITKATLAQLENTPALKLKYLDFLEFEKGFKGLGGFLQCFSARVKTYRAKKSKEREEREAKKRGKRKGRFWK